MGKMKDKDDLFESEEMKILEEARETQRHEGFISDLFLGEASFDYVRPFPEQSSEDKQKADEFIERFRSFRSQDSQRVWWPWLLAIKLSANFSNGRKSVR